MLACPVVVLGWEAELARASAGMKRDAAAAFRAHAEACNARGARPEHLGDLCLAWGAAQGDPAALRRFEAHVRGEVDAAARRVDGAPSFVDDVRQAVRVRLLVAPAGAPPKIAEYVGRGPLRAWVAVAALRIALNAKRDRGPAHATMELLAERVASDADPELRHLKTAYRAELRAAVEASVAALPERARAILRLTFADGLRLAAVARLYGVHEATVSRWVSQAADAVARDARKRLAARLALSPSGIESVVRMARSHLELALAAVFGAPERP